MDKSIHIISIFNRMKRVNRRTAKLLSLEFLAVLIQVEQDMHFTVKTCLKRPRSKRPKVGFQDQLSFNAGQKYGFQDQLTLNAGQRYGFQDQSSLNAGQKYCRMLQGEHSAILSTFIKLPLVIKLFVLSIFEWPFKTGFTVYTKHPEKAL